MTTLAQQPDLSALRGRLTAQLVQLRRGVRTHLATEGAAIVLAQVVGMGFFTFLLDHWLRLGRPARLCLLAASVGFVGFELWKRVLVPLMLRLDFVDLVGAIDRTDRTVDRPLAAQVATVLELPQLLSNQRNMSQAMTELAVRRAAASLANAGFARRLNVDRMALMLLGAAALVFVPAALALAHPDTTGLWARRWFMASNDPWPQDTYLEIAGLHEGRLLVPRGEPTVLRASSRIGSKTPESITVRYRDTTGEKNQATMTRFAPNDFRLDLPAFQNDTSVEIWGGDDEPDPFTISPIDRPRIEQLMLVSKHPRDAAPQTHLFNGQDSDLSFLPMTDLELSFTANVPVGEAKLTTPTTQPAASDLRRIDDRHFALHWVQQHPVQLTIELATGGESAGRLSSLPVPVSIGLKADLPPRVSASFTGVRQRISPMATIPLTITARDDYGVAKVTLASRFEYPEQGSAVPPVDGQETLVGPLDPATQTEIVPKKNFAVGDLKLTPGALLSLTASATDACYMGAQTSSSRSLAFRIVPPEELFREILLRQQGERARFRKAIDAAQKIRDALPTANAPDAAGALLRQHRLFQREVWGVYTILSDSRIEIQLNALGSPEAYVLMDERILKPLRALHDDLLNAQRDALDSLAKTDDPQRRADAVARQDEVITRMQEVLKQMAQWDSFVDVINQLNEVIRVQTQVKTTTDDLNKKQTDSVFEK